MNNGNNPDLEQEEQERREQALREEQEGMGATRNELPPGSEAGDGQDPGDLGRDPVIINRGG